ncbi:alpha/beta fold hydrolase [Micromonospora sp. PTRAS2]|uniref:alpha/beta fold hydrolase n=1 Tax=Micromonospora TaxID=1873 RepID=UPI00098D11EF|nr:MULTISPECIES: alpha/beta hydrolase [unclassified Micromonospora]OON33098.1 alpha/beta hydrolase [Micromonospora sp. Rc5]
MADRRAVLIPGRGYDTRAPLFAYVGEALRRIGFDTHEITWQVPSDLGADRAGPWVAEQVAPALAEPAHLLVGKSLGSFAAPFAADRGLPAVWLTPLLRRADVTEALARATAPFLLVGGTADALWDGTQARRLSPHVLEVDGADHSLLVPGPLARSAEVLGMVCTAVEEFLGGAGSGG